MVTAQSMKRFLLKHEALSLDPWQRERERGGGQRERNVKPITP